MVQEHPAATVRSSDPAAVLRRRRSRIPAIAGPLVVSAAAVVAVAGCGGSNNSSGEKTSPAPSAATTSSSGGGAAAAMIQTANVGQLGQILVGGQARTVYLFQKDTGTTSACSGSCAAVWPPVTAGGKPQAGSGVDASKLGTTKRSDGTTEVTYSGHPLYYYAPDGTTGGSANGQGLNQFGAKWYVLSPSGAPVTKQQSGGGGGY
ncbi:COG4315 family predicted lipoprotein [Actinomadura mexicana]|uniref:Predicted lipoprotein with conserved Yx(FWY)xxD motif n=1 Tax=Actinomadura mexicana TaxID=134959 RepID=A0A238WQZ8_9ACTN|nr:hypothetical protein [Actinomadura mexicana]SNR49030.1 Predicted lipoprotein with conserved Yx(FWY)xxD motif [Actinomadura mexicana]